MYIFITGYILSVFLGGIINSFACLFQLKEYVIYSSKFKENELFEREGQYLKLCGFIMGEMDNFIVVKPKGKKPVNIDKNLIEIITSL